MCALALRPDDQEECGWNAPGSGGPGATAPGVSIAPDLWDQRRTLENSTDVSRETSSASAIILHRITAKET